MIKVSILLTFLSKILNSVIAIDLKSCIKNTKVHGVLKMDESITNDTIKRSTKPTKLANCLLKHLYRTEILSFFPVNSKNENV